MFNSVIKQVQTPIIRYYRRFQSPNPLLSVLHLLLLTLLLNACSSDVTLTATPNSPGNFTSTASASSLLPNTPKPSNGLPETTKSLTALPDFTFALTSIPTNNLTPLPTRDQPTTTALSVVNNQGVLTSGCGKIAQIKSGTSVNESIAAAPAGARGSTSRTYRLHLPAKYQENVPQAVLLVFHGHGGTASEMEMSTGFSSLADQQNFIVVYPQGIADDDGLPMWASVGPAADYGIDELTFTNNLLDQLEGELCVNTTSIYATGFSNGGGMSNYLACKLSDRIAGIVPIAGNYFELPDGGCQPHKAVSLLEIHGSADDVNSYNGRPDKDYPGWPLPAIPEYMALWAGRNNCGKGPQTFLDSKEALGEEWTQCRDNSVVAHYKIKGGGHSYPASIGGRPSSEIIWSFLDKHLLHS